MTDKVEANVFGNGYITPERATAGAVTDWQKNPAYKRATLRKSKRVRIAAELT